MNEGLIDRGKAKGRTKDKKRELVREMGGVRKEEGGRERDGGG